MSGSKSVIHHHHNLHDSSFSNNNSIIFDSLTLSSMDCDSVSVIGTPTMNPKGRFVSNSRMTAATPFGTSSDVNGSPFKAAAHKLRLTSTSTFSSSMDGRRQSISDDDSGCVFEDYSSRPPTVPPDLVYEYFKCLPPEKVPYFKSVGEDWRKNQLDYQQPAFDSNPRYCNTQSEIQAKKCFDLWRSEALGRGTVKIANFDKCDFAGQYCRTCQAKIFSNEIVVSLDKFMENKEFHVWHPACFNCTTCKELLVDLNYCLFNGKIYCGRHHAEMFKPRCPACDEIIFANEGIEAGGATYHIDHFVCTSCRNSVGENKYVMKDNSHPMCLPCYQKDHCAACRASFRAEDAKVTRGSYFWHANNRCFACSYCQGSLLGKEFLKNDDDADGRDERLFCDTSCKTQFEGLDAKIPNLMQTRLSSAKPATKSREKRSIPATKSQKSQTLKRSNNSNNENIDKNCQQQQSRRTSNEDIIAELKNKQKRQVKQYSYSEGKIKNRDDNDSSSSESNYASISPKILRPVKKIPFTKEVEKINQMVNNTTPRRELEDDEYDTEAHTSKFASPILDDLSHASTSSSLNFKDQEDNGNVQPYETTILPSTLSPQKKSPSMKCSSKNSGQLRQYHLGVQKLSNFKSVRFCSKTLKAKDDRDYPNNLAHVLKDDSDSDDSSSVDDNYSMKKSCRSLKSKIGDEIDWSSTTSSDEDDDYALKGDQLPSDVTNLESLTINERRAKNFRRYTGGEPTEKDKMQAKKRICKNKYPKSNNSCLIS